MDTPKNKELEEKGCAADRIIAWRTTGKFWGKERSVVVTYNPRTAAKQRYVFDKKLGRLQDGLFEMRSKVRAGKRHWTRISVTKIFTNLCIYPGLSTAWSL